MDGIQEMLVKQFLLRVRQMGYTLTETPPYTIGSKINTDIYRGKTNVKLFDSLHLAAAEYANADVFLTADAQLMKAAARTDIKIRVENPLAYYMEVLNNE